MLHKDILNIYKSTLSNTMRNPKLFLATIALYCGILLIGSAFIDNPSVLFSKQFTLPFLGGIVSIVASFFIVLEIKKRRLLRETRFTDIDEKQREVSDKTLLIKLLDEITDLKINAGDKSNFEKLEALLTQQSNNTQEQDKGMDAFSAYFYGLKKIIEQKANSADEKASMLLDKGTAYSKWGILFFIISIVIWQILASKYQFQTQYLYGIVSCSILFIFIEFLSAWFLRQYRHFVDTSTYLIKVKSIFDRYMLAYLATAELMKNEDLSKDRANALVKLLSDDIKWPDTYLYKSADVSFAKEAMEAMTHLVKTMKSEAQGQAENK